MPDRALPGRSLVTRRAVVDIVRAAVRSSYGVTGVAASPLERLAGRFGLREPGIRVRLDRGLEIDLHLTVGHALPVAEVARQVDSAVRYAIRRTLERDVRRLTIHVGGLRYHPASVPPAREVAATPVPEPLPAAPQPAAMSADTRPLDAAPDDGEGGNGAALASVGRRGRRRRRTRADGRDPA